MSRLAFGTPNCLDCAWPWCGIQFSGECWKCRVYLWHLWNILSQLLLFLSYLQANVLLQQL
ncbi:hypothetical protein GW17_00008573 [Ensete ventricosum]|uniref:Uncharacterized protein n=1 Tax=Ensete ventricosum TaxID=4639 RepID=A0A444FWL6_ENSVE|nr:hypothetical protein B296_00006875 [Ensete ventricosum]RWW27026.1 hypothetical protein GW17_00008573 [Ensete ventricosum]RZR80266.1 hypothetical protein BHM03_00006248 [Ensete ventricosum]